MCNHSAGHIGGMGGFRIGTSNKSKNATNKKDDGERHYYTNFWSLRERERERESGGAIGGESQGVNVVVGLVCTTKGWDIDCQ